MSIMSSDSEESLAAPHRHGEASGTDLAGYDAQLATTKMFFTRKRQVAFAKSEELVATTQFVR